MLVHMCACIQCLYAHCVYVHGGRVRVWVMCAHAMCVTACALLPQVACIAIRPYTQALGFSVPLIVITPRIRAHTYT